MAKKPKHTEPKAVKAEKPEHEPTVVHKKQTRCKCGSTDIICDNGVRTRPGGRKIRYCHCQSCGRSVIEIVD